jgi:hypothetical protein
MQAIEKNTVSNIAKNFSSISNSLPEQSQQAWEHSLKYLKNYLVEHADNESGLSEENSAFMATARLDWLLRQTREELCGLFSLDDMVMLMDCYQGDMFFPDQMYRIASDLCDHLGIEIDEYESYGIAPLIEKLRSLTAVQRIALADALEQAWYRGMKQENNSLNDFFAALGIDLI